MKDWRFRNIITSLAFGGKSFSEVGFPDEWEYNPVIRCYEKDGFNSAGGREKYCLTEKEIYESISR